MMLLIYVLSTIAIILGIGFSVWSHIDTNRRNSSHDRQG